MDNLARDCIRAKALGYGCHYGKYKADHPQPIQQRETPKLDEAENTVCPSCGIRFYPKRRSQIYCGTDCQSKAYYLKIKESRGERDAVNCPVCCTKFTPRWGMKYCSEECRSRKRNEARRKRRNNGSN